MNDLEMLEEQLKKQETAFTDAASKELAAHIKALNVHIDRLNKNRNQLSAYLKTGTDVLETIELIAAYQQTIEAIRELEETKKQCIECLIKVSANHIIAFDSL